MAQVSKYRYLLNQYPETVQKEQFRIICHISKRTARYLLQSGLVPCVQSGKKTRNYTIKMKDIVRYQNGYWCSGNGSYHSLIPGAAEGFGLQWESISTDDPQAVVDTLASGKLIVALMSKGHFTSSGHFMVLRGVTSEGKILVADPASKKRSEQEWDISIILDEARKGAAAGGPLWAIY